MNSNRRGRGYLPDPAGHRVTSVHHLLAAQRARVGAAMPSLLSVAPSVLNQGPTSSCTGYAARTAFRARLAYLGTPIAEVSPGGIYTVARCLDVGPDDPIFDNGAEPNQIGRGCQAYGIASEAAWPFSVERINDKPTLGELELLATFAGIYAVPDGDVDTLAKTLEAGIPVCVATWADGFEDWSGGAAIAAPPLLAVPDHYICLLDAKTVSKSGRREFTFQNSWGEPWGEGGYGRGSEAWARKLTGCNAFDVRRSS